MRIMSCAWSGGGWRRRTHKNPNSNLPNQQDGRLKSFGCCWEYPSFVRREEQFWPTIFVIRYRQQIAAPQFLSSDIAHKSLHTLPRYLRTSLSRNTLEIGTTTHTREKCLRSKEMAILAEFLAFSLNCSPRALRATYRTR